eukprot:gene10654-11782_t
MRMTGDGRDTRRRGAIGAFPFACRVPRGGAREAFLGALGAEKDVQSIRLALDRSKGN